MFEIIEHKSRGRKRVHERTIDTLKMLYGEGKTLEQLGYFLGISRERVRQLFEREGVQREDGGASARGAKRLGALQIKRIASQKKSEGKMEKIFQCSYEELTSICGMPVNYSNIGSRGSTQLAYFQQKRNAAARGIAWEMSLPEWWKIWQDSGYWSSRGRGSHNYCMSRKNDQGAYCPTNVEIVTNLVNTTSGQTKFDFKKNQRDELGLSSAERRVYDMIQAGFSSPTVIGRRLKMKPNTIGQIKQNLKARLGIFNGIRRELKRATKRGNGT